jgi:hypothetical protein
VLAKCSVFVITIKMIKYKRVGWEGHVAFIGGEEGYI